MQQKAAEVKFILRPAKFRARAPARDPLILPQNMARMVLDIPIGL
jgi:hypothetical protein